MMASGVWPDPNNRNCKTLPRISSTIHQLGHPKVISVFLTSQFGENSVSYYLEHIDGFPLNLLFYLWFECSSIAGAVFHLGFMLPIGPMNLFDLGTLSTSGGICLKKRS